jgi:hypothetical protein
VVEKKPTCQRACGGPLTGVPTALAAAVLRPHRGQHRREGLHLQCPPRRTCRAAALWRRLVHLHKTLHSGCFKDSQRAASSNPRKRSSHQPTFLRCTRPSTSSTRLHRSRFFRCLLCLRRCPRCVRVPSAGVWQAHLRSCVFRLEGWDASPRECACHITVKLVHCE